jgi:hypothetical protein
MKAKTQSTLKLQGVDPVRRESMTSKEKEKEKDAK